MSVRKKAETAAQQLRRILDVIPQLADGEPHPILEVAERAGVDLKTIFADINSLSARFAVPGGFIEQISIDVEGDTICVFSNHLRRPMRLTMSELCALELGLSMLRIERPEIERGPIESAISRLREAISNAPADETPLRVADLGGEHLAAHHATFNRALLGHRKVRLTYRGSSEGSGVERTVRPYALLHHKGCWYAIAFCEKSGDVRFFRLDRMERSALLDATFDYPEGFSADALIEDGKLFRSEAAGTMRVRYSPKIARWIAEREGKPVGADGSLTLEHPLADRAWAMRHVLQYGPDAEVLEPAELRSEIAGRLRAVLA